jgi:hypothetical protein
MKVRLNLATAPFENHRRFLLGSTVLGGVAVGALAVLSMDVYRGWRESRSAREQAAGLETQMRQFRK